MKSSESLNFRRRTTIKAGAILSSMLLLTACGQRINAESLQIPACTSADDSDVNAFSDKGKGSKFTSIKAALQKASDNIIILHDRAQENNGGIDLSDHWNTEVTSTRDSLTLAEPDNLDFANITHNLTFTFKDGRPALAAGAIACSLEGGLYPTVVYTDLERIVEATAAFDR